MAFCTGLMHNFVGNSWTDRVFVAVASLQKGIFMPVAATRYDWRFFQDLTNGRPWMIFRLESEPKCLVFCALLQLWVFNIKLNSGSRASIPCTFSTPASGDATNSYGPRVYGPDLQLPTRTHCLARPPHLQSGRIAKWRIIEAVQKTWRHLVMRLRVIIPLRNNAGFLFIPRFGSLPFLMSRNAVPKKWLGWIRSPCS